MIKRRPESKKKKSLAPSQKTQKFNYLSQPEKLLFKLTNGLLPPKLPPPPRQPKPTASTASSGKLRLSKENVYQPAFSSKKTSETMTPFDYDGHHLGIKCRGDFRFLFQIGSGGFGRVWKVEDKKTSCIFAMKEMAKAK
jgi:serum/glucocorticoid-regulated kinase 2